MSTPEPPVPTQPQENIAKPSSLREVKPLSFIFEIDNALSPEICGEMIRRFESKADQQYPGRIGQGEAIEQSIKRSTDLRVSGRADWKDIDTALVQSLMRAFNEAAQTYPFFAANSFKDMGLQPAAHGCR